MSVFLSELFSEEDGDGNEPIADDDRDEPRGEVTIGEEWMIECGFLEEPEGDCAENERREYELRSMQDENTSDEEEEENATDQEFRPIRSEENGESEDTIRSVAIHVFEILDGEDEGIGDEEEEEEWFRKCLELIWSDEEETGEEDEEARAGCGEGRDEGESLESEWRSGIHGGDRLVAEDDEKYFERNDASENE